MFEPSLTSVISLAVISVLVCVTAALIMLRSKEDRRISKRFEIHCEVEFSANGTSYRGTTRDISLTGLSIETADHFGPDTMLDIIIDLPDSTASRLKGKVVRTIENGIGVKIIENNSDYMKCFKSLSKQK